MLFSGIIEEFPFLAVDRFNTAASTVLLTHCHSDHLVGIHNKLLAGQILCTEATRLLLARDAHHAAAVPRITTLGFNVPLRLPISEDLVKQHGQVFITLIDAYHCVGAAMFLVEGSHKAVLCTGDVRAESWWIDSICRTPALAPYVSGKKTLDNVYFDLSFAYRGEPYVELPPNQSGIQAVVSLLQEYCMDDPEIKYLFKDTTLGFEEAWAHVAEFFSGKITIEDPQLRQKLLICADNEPVYGATLKLAMERESGPQFLGGRPKVASHDILVEIQQSITFNAMDFAGVNLPVNISELTEPEQLGITTVQTTQTGNKLVRFRGRNWIAPLGKKILLPTIMKLMFSRHSSYLEMYRVVEMLKPRQVFPIEASARAWANGFSMQRLFGNVSGPDFVFDTRMAALWGTHSPDLVHTDVRVIDRWQIEECQHEGRQIEQLLIENGAFINNVTKNATSLTRPILELRKVGKKLDTSRYHHSGAHLLQKMVDGRSSTFAEFVRQQQFLYYKRHLLPHYERNFHMPKYAREFTLTLGGSSDYDTDSCSSSLELVKRNRATTSLEYAALDTEGLDDKNPEFGKIQSPSRRRKRPVLHRKVYSPCRPRRSLFVGLSFPSQEISFGGGPSCRGK